MITGMQVPKIFNNRQIFKIQNEFDIRCQCKTWVTPLYLDISRPTEAQEEYILAPFKYTYINRVNSVWIISTHDNTVHF